MKNNHSSHLSRQLESAFPKEHSEPDVKMSSYSGAILIFAAVIFVGCLGLFLYGIMGW